MGNQEPPMVTGPTVKPASNRAPVNPVTEKSVSTKGGIKQASLASAITKVASDKQFQLEIAAYKNGILKGMTPPQRS